MLSLDIVPFCEDFYHRSPRATFVAQVGNLLYRRLTVGGTSKPRTRCGLPIRDTADCQSALLWLRLRRAMSWRLGVNIPERLPRRLSCWMDSQPVERGLFHNGFCYVIQFHEISCLQTQALAYISTILSTHGGRSWGSALRGLSAKNNLKVPPR